MRSTAVVGVYADRNYLSPAKHAHDQVTQLMRSDGEQLTAYWSVTDPGLHIPSPLTFRAEITSLSTGKFQAMIIATNMTHAAIMVLRSTRLISASPRRRTQILGYLVHWR